MTSSHRAWHARIWAVLLPLLLVGVIVALARREDRPISVPRAAAAP